MPANLTPDYHCAEEKFRKAATDEERVAALEEMLRVIPKHKGTSHMQADLKTRLSKLRKEAGRKKAPGRKSGHFVEAEGIGQVFLLGPPNSGKSTLLDLFSKAAPKIGDYPFTTRTFQPGMLRHQNVWIQLVDMPPISREFMETWVPSVARYGDLALLVLDLSSDEVLDQAQEVLDLLKEGKVSLAGEGEEFGQMDSGMAVLRTLLVGMKSGAPGADERLAMLRELLPTYKVYTLDSQDPSTQEGFSAAVYAMLDKVRVYAKQPGKPADKAEPFVLDLGATVIELAEKIHRDLAQRFQFARIWGEGKIDGRKVNRDYILEEEDVVELHVG
jgi:ribosome-interacting GTPase 1